MTSLTVIKDPPVEDRQTQLRRRLSAVIDDNNAARHILANLRMNLFDGPLDAEVLDKLLALIERAKAASTEVAVLAENMWKEMQT